VKKGKYFEKIGVLQGINEKNFSTSVLVEEVNQVFEFKYEEICKNL